MNVVREERESLCDLLVDKGPNAPTLCEGWTTRDLTTHLILRESDPVAAVGMFWSRFASVTQRHAYNLSVRTDFPALVARLRGGPPRLSPFSFGPIDRAANPIEFFVHHEDVRRAGDSPLPPRSLTPGVSEVLWAQLRTMSRMVFSSAPVGVVLETDEGKELRVRPGNATVHVIGPVGELVMFATGRTAAAAVEVVGGPESVRELTASLGF